MRTVCIKTISDEKIEFLNTLIENLPINVYISNHRFKVYNNLIIHYTEKEYIDEFYEAMAIAIKKLIEEFYQENFIRKNIEKNYFYLSAMERKYILEITKKVLELPDEKIGNINLILKNTIKNYIIDNKKIIIEGFVNFRIKDYKELLDRLIEVSVFSYLDLIIF